MTVYLFHVVEEKTQKSLLFCKFEETFKEQSFRIHSIQSSIRSKIEDKGKDEAADPDSQKLRPAIAGKKICVGELSFFASFKSYNYFSEESACFINSQSLTACQKQTRPVIKISRHRF